ncbi:hypothetical protein MHBO_000413 [Bonamia ostreae]|uniref:Uncharacterized protein n=1 Tax=Bonamia ostreae TaxID=126728 RepID=A0ABV2AFL8_9EUKA
MMCPQLYINYKLKSVAHLPWRMMTYKALNTVVDDFFAFVIKMPFLHRIACFRDDLVFAVFLYQKWKYRVDYTRTNEFGYTPLNENNKDSLYKGKIDNNKDIDNNNNKDIDNNNNKEIDNNNNKEIDNKIESKKIAKPKVE